MGTSGYLKYHLTRLISRKVSKCDDISYSFYFENYKYIGDYRLNVRHDRCVLFLCVCDTELTHAMQ